ncbi:hypothetical protein QBC44DRAFT_132579 [Cladorrhinum sp. PSN332]|nr:hypothetical protein QBC44DRAFT_132579 [Cladorrhinum sp. PSN332]
MSNSSAPAVVPAVVPPAALPTSYIDRILQRPTIREDLVLEQLRRHAQSRHYYMSSYSPYPRIGVMDWKSKDTSNTPETSGSLADVELRQFNMTSLDRSGVLGIKTFAEWPLGSAAQIAATDEHLEKCLLNMDGIESRIILLEQMPAEVMDILGSIYNIDPQFWAQHLLAQGNDSWLWETSQQTKPFFSVRSCQPVSFDIESPPWANDWKFGAIRSNNNADELLQWFRSSHEGHLGTDTIPNGPRRRLRPMFHSHTQLRDGRYPPVPAGLDQCVSMYFHQSNSVVTQTTVIVLVDPCPLARRVDNNDVVLERSLLSARPLAPSRVPPLDLENRWILDDVWDSIKQNRGSALLPDFSPGLVVWSVLEVFQRDLIATASRSHLLIEEIRRGMRDPATVEDNLRSKSWEHLLSNLAELDPMYRHALKTFSMALSVTKSVQQGTPTQQGTLAFHGGPSVDLAEENALSGTAALKMSRLLHILDQVSASVEKTQSAFESRIALTERQHQLHEAKTMKRLTELAFLFIPLSLSTSIFGMEMKEFQDGIPLYIWVITSASLLLAAYGIRWFLTSRLWRSLRTHWTSAVVTLYPKYRGDEGNTHKSAYVTAIPYPIYKPILSLLNLIHRILRYPEDVPCLTPRSWAAIKTLYVTTPLASFLIIWTRDSLGIDGKVAWTIFGSTVCLYMWIWIPLALNFPWRRGHSSRLGIFFLLIVPTLSLLSSVTLFTLGWALPNLGVEARAGWAAAGAVMVMGALSLLVLRNAVRFRIHFEEDDRR